MSICYAVSLKALYFNDKLPLHLPPRLILISLNLDYEI